MSSQSIDVTFAGLQFKVIAYSENAKAEYQYKIVCLFVTLT